jgi:hypothetical protein
MCTSEFALIDIPECGNAKRSSSQPLHMASTPEFTKPVRLELALEITRTGLNGACRGGIGARE